MPYSEAGGMFSIFRPLIRATDGLTLGQVCAITGLEPSTVQNWVKRGFVPHPVRKKYHERQLARILLISALRESMQIDRIGEITASIFSVVKLKPERRDEVHKFMSYYLPTTMKLLESYSLLEKQSYQGENIVAARKDIEKIIGTMVPVFEKQLDRLFQADALDISTDIEVLETMMAKDGLTEQGKRLRMGASGGH